MEQQFKTDGLGLSNRKSKKREKGLSNREAMNEDRISELPDALLLQILSLLPTENVIATSVLSKRWRSVWKMVPKLKFDYGFHQLFENKDPHVYSENVYRCLTLHKAPVLESLHLDFEGKIDYMDVGIWIATAFARPVRKLVLVRDDYEEDQIFILPNVLFTYNDTLEILKLKYAIEVDFPSRVCLKSLRKLCLYRVRYKDEESVSNFLCGCPSLEDLVVHRYSDLDVSTFTIAVPSLQRLTIKDINEEGCFGNGGYVINAPALKYLHLKRFNDLKSCLIEKAPELVEAKMNDVSNITNENILESLTSAKRLTLRISTLAITVPTGKIFDQLVYLKLHTHVKMWWELLSVMLESSPKLQILKLSDLYHDARHKFLDERKWNPPKCVPECLLFHLETFVWKSYKWQREDEKEVATYILTNAKCLKKATFSRFGYSEKNLEKERREVLNELASVVRASDSCHLVFESV